MNWCKHILLLLLMPMMLIGCRVHQWPEPRPTRVPVVLRLQYNTDWYVWEHTYDPKTGVVSQLLSDNEGVDQQHPATSYIYDGLQSYGTMRYIVRAYPVGDHSKFTDEFIFTRDITDGYDCYLNLDLEEGEYDLFVWSDIYEDSESELFYNAVNFMNLSLLYDPYRACTDRRDAYRGTTIFTATSTDTAWGYGDDFVQTDIAVDTTVIIMERPLGKFELITTDLKEFLDKETTRNRGRQVNASVNDYKVRIHYPAYLPVAYNVFDDRLVDSETSIFFNTSLTPLNEQEASLGFDYVFVNNVQNASVAIQVEILDSDDERAAISYMVSVPLRRNHHTILRSPFITIDADGGIYVDPEFDGDYNIIL